MRSPVDTVLWSGIYDDLNFAFVRQLLFVGGIDDVLIARRVAQDAVRRLIGDGLAVVGYGAGKKGKAMPSPGEAMAAFEAYLADWSRDADDLDFVLSLTPAGDAAGRAIQADRDRHEHAVLRALAGRHPEIAGPLDVTSDEEIRRMRLADLTTEGRSGRAPKYRPPLGDDHLRAIFATLDEIFLSSDPAVPEVILDEVPYPTLTGALDPFLGPALRAQAVACRARRG